jgi:pimeloyl-ACP methyl ester carboxylesterase/ketosteroid isomerase-like protein
LSALGALLGASLLVGGGDARFAVHETLDDFHRAAAAADAERYFGHFAPEAVFLGTDAGERWSVEDLRAYATPYFSKGQGWTYVASARDVRLSTGGDVAWFDERLQNEKYGEARGSGVLELLDGRWRIASYNLAFPVPNGQAGELTARVLEGEAVGQPVMTRLAARDGERELVLWNESVPAVVEAGEAPIVVLLPSATFSARATWSFPLRDYSVSRALARRGFDAFAVELGGYGGSSAPAGADPRGGCASAVRDLGIALDRIAELRGERPVLLVGPSWGAQVAGAYAAAHPERVRGLVLYGFRWRGRIPAAVVEEVFGAGVLRATTRPVTEEGARADFVEGFHEPDVPAAFAEHLLAAGEEVPTGALVDHVERLPLVDPSRLEMPTLLLYGRLEFVRPAPDGGGELLTFDEARDEQREFLAALPGDSHWIEIPGAGHSAHLDRPHALFQRCLIGWLERVP